MANTQITPDFMKAFLFETETKWASGKINNGVYGFQFQPGMKWNPGLSQEEINSYQSVLGIPFPKDLVTFLQYANGTDQKTVNVYDDDGNPHAYASGVYRYPHDIEAIKQRIEWLAEDWEAALESLKLEADVLGKNPKFAPIYSHRYVLCNGNPDSSIVCSIQGSDAIVYGSSLKEYLQNEFLS
ncbi:MAG: SMI1/KNR4 family protein [Rhizobiales bacterium]|nr:SMI1/KNR4 family protein [Hyphomicrobiales bacterium]